MSYSSINDSLLERKIDLVTEGLESHYVNRLRALSSTDDTKTIVSFISNLLKLSCLHYLLFIIYKIDRDQKN
jgi:hypothetical protein